MTFVIPSFFLDHAPKSNGRTDSYAEWLTCFRPSTVLFGGQDDGWRTVTWGKRATKIQKLPNRGVNRQFKTKMPKSIHRTISPERWEVSIRCSLQVVDGWRNPPAVKAWGLPHWLSSVRLSVSTRQSCSWVESTRALGRDFPVFDGSGWVGSNVTKVL